MKKNLGTADRRTVDQYTDNVREIERRLGLAKNASTSVAPIDEPNGIPSTYDKHIELHYDLIALGFQADITRVATLLGARDLTGASYPLPKSDLFPDGGTSPSYHGGSHHQDNPANIANYAKIGRYHVSKMAYFAQKLKSIPDGDGTLLDHSLILYGTNMGNSNQHQHYDVPHILVGGAGGKHKGDRQINFDRKTWRTGILLLSVLDLFGIHNETQGDSNVTKWSVLRPVAEAVLKEKGKRIMTKLQSRQVVVGCAAILFLFSRDSVLGLLPSSDVADAVMKGDKAAVSGYWHRRPTSMPLRSMARLRSIGLFSTTTHDIRPTDCCRRQSQSRQS